MKFSRFNVEELRDLSSSSFLANKFVKRLDFRFLALAFPDELLLFTIVPLSSEISTFEAVVCALSSSGSEVAVLGRDILVILSQ